MGRRMAPIHLLRCAIVIALLCCVPVMCDDAVDATKSSGNEPKALKSNESGGNSPASTEAKDPKPKDSPTPEEEKKPQDQSPKADSSNGEQSPTSEKESSPKTSSEKDSSPKTSSEEESSPKTSSEKDSSPKTSSEKDSSPKTSSEGSQEKKDGGSSPTEKAPAQDSSPKSSDKASDSPSDDYSDNPDDLDEFDEDEDEFDNFDEEEDYGDSPEEATPPSSKNETSSDASPSETTTEKSDNASTLKDISPTGNCSGDINSFCKGLPAGEGTLLLCLSDKIKAEKAANDKAVVSIACKNEIRDYKIAMYKDISMDAPLQKACKDDIKKLCDEDFLYPEPGSVLLCLREVKQLGTVSEMCQVEITRAQIDAAEDFRNDPQLYSYCKADAQKLCSDVPTGEGRIQHCLRSKRTKLSWDCQAELFRQEVENSADIRLNVRLFRACTNDKRKYCADVLPGDSRIKDCLEEHKDDSGFSTECKDELELMMSRRAVDFRLDPSLGKYCKADIAETCYPDAEDITDVASWDAKVIQCLQDFRDELKNPKCRQQVRKLTKRAGEDIRFDKPVYDACHEDRITTCKDVPDGMGQVLRCLQDHVQKLKDICRSALFDLEVRTAEEIDFLFSMKKACSEEVNSICKGIPEGHGAVIKCLTDKVTDPEMGSECKAEVKRNEMRAAQDYRLNYRLNKACYKDVQKTCLHVCDKSLENGTLTCGGAVLKCLSLNKKNLTSPACKKEVHAFEKEMAADISLDVPLQAACRADLDKFCPKISRDHTRTLACLRNNRDSLTKACKAEELRFSEMEASDIRLTPSLMNACGQELQFFCKDVPSEEGKAFKCLQTNLEEVGMSSACKVEVNLQEARKASDYRLDVSVKAVCEGDADRLCQDVDRSNLGHAVMLKCFVRNFKDLSGTCQTEVAYAVRAALFQYRQGADLTSACDADVASLCASEDAKEIGGAVIGVYGQCLMAQQKGNLTRLSPQCRRLVKIMARKGAHVSGKIDEEQLQAAISKIAQLQASKGFVLSGWVAIFALLVILGLFLAAGYAVYLKYYSPSARYTLVVKSGDV